jgi:hypothetical protein
LPTPQKYRSTHLVAFDTPVSFENGYMVTDATEGKGACQPRDAATNDDKINGELGLRTAPQNLKSGEGKKGKH